MRGVRELAEAPRHEIRGLLGDVDRVVADPLEGPRHEDHVDAPLAARDDARAEDLVRQDDLIDRLNRECFTLALDIGDDPRVREWAMHMMLIARSIERIGDNAVDIGEQTAFVVTGLFREFSDSSGSRL